MKRLLIMLLVLAAGAGIFVYMTKNPVRVSEVAAAKVYPMVRVQLAQEVDCTLEVLAHGQVEPVTHTQLVSEAAGAAIEVSDKLKVGGEFRQGELMLQLEDIRYRQAVEQAKLNVAEAELRVVQENTKAAQAMRDWKKLGRSGEPSTLSLRVPQLKAAEALLASSKVALEKAQYDLAKTQIKAPYDCVVVAANVDDGGFVSVGAKVAEIYSQDARQVRLPVKLEYFPYVNDGLLGKEVQLNAQVGGATQGWFGKVARVERIVDRMTQSIMLVVELDKTRGSLPPFGLYVDADVNLGLLEGVIELPAQALRDNGTVLLVDAESKLQIESVELVHRQNGRVYFSDSSLKGKQVVVSPIEFAVAGMQVELQSSKEDK